MTTQHTPIPFIDLKAQQKAIRPQIEQALKRVLDHGQYGFGPECAAFEDALKQFTGVDYVLACSNGTDALTMLLIDLGIGPGDAVFVPAFTYIATAEVVALRGATPVFVDVHEDSFNMDARDLRLAIKAAQKEGLKLKGIISVDLFGQPADHDAISIVAKDHDLWVINDGAQSCGATYKGQSTLKFGLAATTSFFPAKPLGGYGDGGAIFLNDADRVERLKSIRVHGHGVNTNIITHLGLTGRLDTLQAAILIEKLKIFPSEIMARQKSADIYADALDRFVAVPRLAAGNTSVWAQYTVCTKAGYRDKLQQHLLEQGIPTMIYYKYPLHVQKVYKHGLLGRTLKKTDALAQSVLSLPIHGYLRTDVQERIIKNITSFFKK